VRARTVTIAIERARNERATPRRCITHALSSS
jgi:hypothetical protein